MSLSKALQSRDIITIGSRSGLSALRETIFSTGHAWYGEHPEELNNIINNLQRFNLPADDTTVQSVVEGILLHYYEKVIPLCLPPEEYHDYLTGRVDGAAAVAQLRNLLGAGQGILLTISHFGAVELITPYIAAHHLDITTVLRFTTQHFSDMAAAHAEKLHAEGNFGRVQFIEIGKPGVPAAVAMAAALRRKEILTTVFDEETGYSIPASFFGKQLNGGAGLHKLIQFARCPLAICNAYIIRNEQERYTFKLDMIEADGNASIQSMYHSLENVVSRYPEQWYFLHEHIPVTDPAPV